MTVPTASRWVVPSPRPGARLRLLCFPFAGGGASAFRTWSEDLPPEVEVCAIQPPGREARLKEQPIRSLPSLVDALVEETRSSRDGRFAFFGHSVGALVAFEVTRALRRRGDTTPVHLFVSACGAPQLAANESPLSALPDHELLHRVGRFQGTPDAALEHAELIELMLPTLRADIALRDAYVCAAEPPLDIPITAFGGHGDTDVSVTSLAAWRKQTCARFAMQGFPGAHFFIRSGRTLFLRALATELGRLAHKESERDEPVARPRRAGGFHG